MAEGEPRSLEHTATWVVSVVCFIIVLISFGAERGLRRLGQFLKQKNQESLFEALLEVKGELTLLGFISLLLTVFQSPINRICIPLNAANIMLPCKLETPASSGGSEHLDCEKHGRRLLAEDASSETCARRGKIQLLSPEALHQLHIFIFVLGVVHVISCATILLLASAKIKRWEAWENSIQSEMRNRHVSADVHHRKSAKRAGRSWRNFAVVSWMVSFFRQFYGSVTKQHYLVLRAGFIRARCPAMPGIDFNSYMLWTLEHNTQDCKTIVRISWYLWLFVLVFLLINLTGWHSYFWLSFLPLALLLLVGAKLEQIITQLDKVEQRHGEADAAPAVRPSDDDDLFWFKSPNLLLHLAHFILFQNSFGIAFLFWVWTTYGFGSCMMDKLGFIITRITIGILVLVFCSYITLPLYVLVTQMSSKFDQVMFDSYMKRLRLGSTTGGSHRLANESVDI